MKLWFTLIREYGHVSSSIQSMYMLQRIRSSWQWFNHLDQHLVEARAHISKNASVSQFKYLGCSLGVSRADVTTPPCVPCWRVEEVGGQL